MQKFLWELDNFKFDAEFEPETYKYKSWYTNHYNIYLVLLVTLWWVEWRDSFLKFRISSNFSKKSTWEGALFYRLPLFRDMNRYLGSRSSLYK
jgi:hypothetical protein